MLKVYKEALLSISLGEIVRFCLDRLPELLDFSKIRFRWVSNFERFPLAIKRNSILGGLSSKLRMFGWLGPEKDSILAHFTTTNGKNPHGGFVLNRLHVSGVRAYSCDRILFIIGANFAD